MKLERTEECNRIHLCEWIMKLNGTEVNSGMLMLGKAITCL